jgi:uncharacterized protein YkwD
VPYFQKDKRAGTVRYILLLAVALLTFLIAALAPWPALQRAFTALVTPGPAASSCPQLPPSPNYYASGGEAAALAAINRARASEGLPDLVLPSNYWRLSVPRQQFVLVNLERTSRGLAPLRWDATLAQIATAYSRQMVQLHFFAHTSPISGSFEERLNANPHIANHYRAIGENLAGNWAPAAGAIYEYLYNDAAERCAHRQNILNPQFDVIGIGMAAGGPWHSISTQEMLASSQANPYIGAAPDTMPPTIRLNSTLSASGTRLSVSAAASDNQGIARIIWYLDGLSVRSQQGASWTLNAATLSRGSHQLTAYAVDESQNYATATLSFTVGPQGIAPISTAH